MGKKKKPVDVDNIESPASKVGQMIGEAFERAVTEMVGEYLKEKHPNYIIAKDSEGKKILKLPKTKGAKLQIDTVIASVPSHSPVALLESKWLKDARHHNDKGAWILQLQEVKKSRATIRGLIAVLAGYWTHEVGVLFMTEGGIRMVVVATDDDVYKSLQTPLDNLFLDESFKLIASEMRLSYPRPRDLLRLLVHLQETGGLQSIAHGWLDISLEESGKISTGRDRVQNALDDLLSPLPDNPKVERFQIALQIDTGNTIYEEFTDVEQAMEFIEQHFHNSAKILERIKPTEE